MRRFDIVAVVSIAVMLIAVILWLGFGSHSTTSVNAWRSDAAIRGTTDAPVRMVEFGDFQCPTCKAMVPIFDQLLKDNPTTLEVQYRYFPLPEHANAHAAAEAAQEAQNQGQFWQMYNLLYSEQDSWASLANPQPAFAKFLVLLGLDESHYNDASYRNKLDSIINTDTQFAYSEGLSQTPSIFINNQLYSGPLTEKDIAGTISQVLSDLEHHTVTATGQ